MARGKSLLGFSLVELMTAVGVVGILVAIALPRYRAFIARARTSEAKMNLGIIYGLQQTYKAEFEKYFTSVWTMGNGASEKCGANDKEAQNELGFRATDCKALRYMYTSTGGGGNANGNGTKATKTEIYPNCDEHDFWEITDKRKLIHGRSAIEHCEM